MPANMILLLFIAVERLLI